jgi:hypothetical protein
VEFAIRLQEALEVAAARGKPTGFDEFKARSFIGRLYMAAQPLNRGNFEHETQLENFVQIVFGEFTDNEASVANDLDESCVAQVPSSSAIRPIG